MDLCNSRIVTFESMKDMILNDKSIETAKRFQFSWDGKTKDVITKFIGRSIKSTVKEKRDIVGYDTLPFGYSDN